MEYFLQSAASGRVFIDSEVHKDHIPERVLVADSWIKASDQINKDEFVPIPGHGYFLDFFQANRDTFCK